MRQASNGTRICWGKRIRMGKAVIVLFGMLFLSFPQACAQEVSSADLIKNSAAHNQKNVIYRGEVIGDIMRRGEYAWVNVRDQGDAIGIWMRKDLLKDIEFTGSYAARGDWIEVTGAFSRACTQHGGDLDIHADGLRVLKKGYRTKVPLNTQKLHFSFMLAGILVTVIILRMIKI